MIGIRKAAIVKDAKDRSSIYQSQTYLYVSGGRTYQSDIYDGPRKMRSDVIQHLAYNEKVSAADIFRVELFLKGEPRYRKRHLEAKDRAVIVEKYHLIKDPKDGKWRGDLDALFCQICEEFPNAKQFKNFTDLLYTMRYSDSRNGPVIEVKST